MAVLGADHPMTATVLHDKASALVQMGGSANLAVAAALYDRAIEIKTAALGPDRQPSRCTTRSTLVQMGGSANLAAALALYDRVVEIMTGAFGAEHPVIATALTRRRTRWCRWVGRPTSQWRQRCTTASSRSRRQRWGGSPIDSRRAARQGECVDADGWVGQPRSGEHCTTAPSRS
jgi:hypothetical protein